MAKQLIPFLVLLSFSITLVAQNSTLLEEGEAKTITISHKEQSINSFNNEFLNILGKSQANTSGSVKLEYTVKEHRKIVQRGTKIQLTVSIANMVLQGEHIYQKFKVNDLLIPNLVSYTYHWIDSAGNELKSEKISDQKYKSGAILLKQSVPDNGKAIGSKLHFSNIEFAFNKISFKKFDKFINAVDSYYDADARLNMVNQELDKIRVDTLELLTEFYDITLSNIKYFNQLKAQRLTSTLSLNSNDPIGFKSKFGKIEVRNRELKNKIENTQKNMQIAYYKKGLDWLNWKDVSKASVFFLKSIEVKNNYAPPFYELAYIDFSNKKFKAVLDTCAVIINSKNPDNDTRYSTLKLAEKVIFTYLDSIKTLVNEKQFDIALEKLNYCIKYVKSVEGMRNFEEFDQYYSKIFEGYYNNLAKTVDILIKDKRLNEAHQGIDSLINFRTSNKQYFIEPKAEQNLLNSLHLAWVDAGSLYIKIQKADSAVFALTKAKIICNKHKFVTCSDKLQTLLSEAYIENYKQIISLAEEAIKDELADSALMLLNLAGQQQVAYNISPIEKADTLYLQAKQLKYKGLIQEGSFALNGGVGKQALAYYQAAIDISNEIKIIKDSTLITKTKNAAAAYILMICSQSETYVEAMQMNKAKAGLAKAQSIEKNYNLAKNKEVQLAIEQLANKLNKGICSVVQHNYNIQLGATKKFIEKLDFSNAQNAISKAKKLASESSNCNISIDEINAIEERISGILKYQQKLNIINDDLNKEKFDNAIHAYSKLTQFYTDSVKHNYGITHKNLYKFVFENKHGELLDYGVTYYTEQSDPEKAIELLEELYRREYIASWSKTSQTKLGTYLANRDYKANAEENVKEKVIDYTSNIPWFKYLKKAYLKQWKTLVTN